MRGGRGEATFENGSLVNTRGSSQAERPEFQEK
jgi:hypothetical protein